MKTYMDSLYDSAAGYGYSKEQLDELMGIADRLTPAAPTTVDSPFSLYDFVNGFMGALMAMARHYGFDGELRGAADSKWFKAGWTAGQIHTARKVVAVVDPNSESEDPQGEEAAK